MSSFNQDYSLRMDHSQNNDQEDLQDDNRTEFPESEDQRHLLNQVWNGPLAATAEGYCADTSYGAKGDYVMVPTPGRQERQCNQTMPVHHGSPLIQSHFPQAESSRFQTYTGNQVEADYATTHTPSRQMRRCDQTMPMLHGIPASQNYLVQTKAPGSQAHTSEVEAGTLTPVSTISRERNQITPLCHGGEICPNHLAPKRKLFPGSHTNIEVEADYTATYTPGRPLRESNHAGGKTTQMLNRSPISSNHLLQRKESFGWSHTSIEAETALNAQFQNQAPLSDATNNGVEAGYGAITPRRALAEHNHASKGIIIRENGKTVVMAKPSSDTKSQTVKGKGLANQTLTQANNIEVKEANKGRERKRMVDRAYRKRKKDNMENLEENFQSATAAMKQIKHVINDYEKNLSDECKIVFELNSTSKEAKAEAMKIAACLPGITKVSMEMEDNQLTLTGKIHLQPLWDKLRNICEAELVLFKPGTKDKVHTSVNPQSSTKTYHPR